MTTIEIRPGEGGADAAAFAAELATTLTRHQARHGHTTRATGTAERTVLIETTAPAHTLAWIAGTHRVQRIPEGAAARHTSTATVVILEAAKAGKGWVAGESQVRVDRYRGRGSGGQRKNKVATAIRVVHQPSGTTITRETGRSQSTNLHDAMSDLNRRLGTQAAQAHATRRNEARRDQVNPGREAKTFTHNYQRGEVVDHGTGRRWRLKDWAKGKVD